MLRFVALISCSVPWMARGRLMPLVVMARFMILIVGLVKVTRTVRVLLMFGLALTRSPPTLGRQKLMLRYWCCG